MKKRFFSVPGIRLVTSKPGVLSNFKFLSEMKSIESITMPGLSRYVKAFMGVMTAFLLFMTGLIRSCN